MGSEGSFPKIFTECRTRVRKAHAATSAQGEGVIPDYWAAPKSPARVRGSPTPVRSTSRSVARALLSDSPGGGAIDPLLAAGARANSAPAGCPVGTHSLPSTCFVVGGATFLDGGPKNLTLDECCSACGARRNDPEGERCLGMQWNEAGNAWGSQNRSGCARADTTCCFLFGSAPAVKKPMHPAQQRCESALMPLPPAPPWPATPPAGAKNILHVLVDDLRTQMTPYGTAGQHAFMHTPHFAAFADTAVQFEQAHCNSQMCVPTRNSFMTGAFF